ncbi:hypothetical protein SOVF_076430 [Spinacia oleracea]|nr:hypothetical protein SOVF_076430 [Spinacia oleracea]
MTIGATTSSITGIVPVTVAGGGIDNSSSLFRLQFLQRLSLANNYFREGEIPSAIGKLSSLTYLNLSNTKFSGQVPIEISQLVKLNVLDISGCYRLYMEKPNLATIIRNLTNIRELYLDYVNNSAMGDKWSQALASSLPHLQVLSMNGCDLRGGIHKSLSNLQHLSVIDLNNNDNLGGGVPESLAGLTNLTELSLTYCDLIGAFPEKILQVPTLTSLDLSFNNKLQGTLPEFHMNGSLEVLLLGGTNFSTTMPSSIGNLKKLRSIDIKGCQFHGSIPSSLGSLTLLESLDLSNHQFEGPVPKSLFQLTNLQILDLSTNKLNGTLKLAEILLSFKNLSHISLSFNRLTIDTHGCGVNSPFPKLETLSLASCNLLTIPEFIKNQTLLRSLDLSMNHITGTLPSWIWGIDRLNLSSNHLVELEPPLTISNISMSIDLHSNHLQGNFPITSNFNLLDCSDNNFTSIDIGNYLSYGSYLLFARNNLYGSILTSLCNIRGLELLDLQHNFLGGRIPDCLTAMTKLSVLNLRGNRLVGGIPDKFSPPDEFPTGCSLQTLDLNENFLQGRIPQTLAYCTDLKVLDLGNNQLNDTFPCHLKNLSYLQFLVLRSNKLHGTIVCPENYSNWPQLHIVDLAFNHFNGELRSQTLFKWKPMMTGTTTEQSTLRAMRRFMTFAGGYYQNSLSLTLKGNTYKIQNNLAIYTVIDFSNNAFQGKLPKELGNLHALVVLNLSHNSFLGHIPSSFGNLTQVESLDLSCNAFSGRIPAQLANLNFLEYLNLSFNKLSGKIPTGSQLQLFNASSYEGNRGLYGPPLTEHNPEANLTTSSQGSNRSSKSDIIEWMLRGAEVGFPVGIAIFVGPILYIKRYREWYCRHLHRVVMKILGKEDNAMQRRRRRSRQQQRQRR